MELPLYKSHKQVRALKVGYVRATPEGKWLMMPADIHYLPVEVSQEWYDERYKATVDDAGYYVLYEDGYASWSPSKAFEDGYTKV